MENRMCSKCGQIMPLEIEDISTLYNLIGNSRGNVKIRIRLLNNSECLLESLIEEVWHPLCKLDRV